MYLSAGLSFNMEALNNRELNDGNHSVLEFDTIDDISVNGWI